MQENNLVSKKIQTFVIPTQKKKKNVYVLNRGVVRTQSNIEDEAFCKNRRSIQPLTIFVKNFLLRVLTRFWIRLSFWLENIEKLDEFCCVCKETILNFFFWFHKESPTVCFYHVTYAFRVNLLLPECKGSSCSKQARYLKFKWMQRDPNPQPLSS